MDEEQVLAAIKEKTGLSDEQVDKVNEVIDEHFIIGKDNKDKIVAGIKEKLGIDDAKADEIYNVVMGIIGNGIVNRVKEMLSQDTSA